MLLGRGHDGLPYWSEEEEEDKRERQETQIQRKRSKEKDSPSGDGFEKGQHEGRYLGPRCWC